jgi:hypothetical protein
LLAHANQRRVGFDAPRAQFRVVRLGVPGREARLDPGGIAVRRGDECGVRDVVRCGAGRDRVLVDRVDRVAGDRERGPSGRTRR